MPSYSNTLNANFNVISQVRMEVFDLMPTIEKIISTLNSQAISSRDGWIFMVRQNGVLSPYYFDASLIKIFPFCDQFIGGESGKKYTGYIGNGVDTAFTVKHDLGSWALTADAWRTTIDKRSLVNCDIDMISENEMNFIFSDPPDPKAMFIVICNFENGSRNKYTDYIGNGIDTNFTVKHNLGSWALTCSTWRALIDKRSRIDCDIDMISENEMNFIFSVPPKPKEMFVVVA